MLAAMPDMLSSKETASSVAKMLAQKCNNLSELRAAMGLFEMCSLKKGAKKISFF